MKRNSFIIWISLVVLILINLLFFRNFYNLQINQQKNLLFRQAEVCADEIERVIQKFESDLNYVLFTDDISALFSHTQSDGLRKLELFYSTYNQLVKNIDIYDNQKNAINIFRDQKQNFVTDQYIAQRQRKLADQEEVIMQNDEYQYVLPIFKYNEVYANILVTINLNNFVISELEKFHLNGYTWQWLFDIETQRFQSTDDLEMNDFENIDEIYQNLAQEFEGLLIGEVSNDSIEKKLLTVYTPVKVLNKLFGIGMSIDYSTFLNKIFTQLIGIALASVFIFLAVAFYLFSQLKRAKKKIAN